MGGAFDSGRQTGGSRSDPLALRRAGGGSGRGRIQTAAVQRGSFAIAALLAVALAGCGGQDSSEADSRAVASSPTASAERGFTYVALGDSWPEGAHCAGCRTFVRTHADALADRLEASVTFHNLAGQAQPYFETPGGGGSAGLLRALRTDETFRKKVAGGDIIVISTGPNDGGDIFALIQGGKCGGEDGTACIATLSRKWQRDFDAILTEIERLRAGHSTVIRLVSAANAFNDPMSSPATLRGFEAYFQALTEAMCDNAKKHDAKCVDVRPVLNGPAFEQPVNDSAQAAMDAVAELLLQTGAQELD
jgi:hypothetical protein